MSTLTAAVPLSAVKSKRIESIDLLRGIIILIMALDHVRDYFHKSAFLYNPTDLTHTSVSIFFTRWITHFCAPVFSFLAGVSAYLYGAKNNRKELSFFLFTRGLWLALLEIFIISFGWTFSTVADVIVLQVIWSLGFSMMVLSVMIYLPKKIILAISIVLIAAHDLLDGIHVPGNNIKGFLWSFLHDQVFYSIHHVNVLMGYPLLPWIGIMASGYCLGSLYVPGYDPAKRKKTLICLGLGSVILFIVLRWSNLYGDPAQWSYQKNSLFTFLSFLKTSKYPPSLLFTLMTLGPAMLFLAFAEGPLNAFTEKIIVFGRVPMFFYIAHIYFIHLLAIIAVVLSGRNWSQMILNTWVSNTATLKGYGYNLIIVYIIWLAIIIILYPLCKWYDKYKRAHVAEKKWLSYL